MCKRPTYLVFSSLIASGLTIFELASHFDCSKNSIRNWLKNFEITPPKGFYSRGLKLGRKPGYVHSQEWKDAMSIRMRGDKNGFANKTHSNETRKKMSENHADFTGDKNPFKRSLEDPTKLENFKKACQQRWDKRDKEWRRNFSEKLSRSMVSSEANKSTLTHHKHQHGHFFFSKAGSGFLRSSWELITATILEELPEVVKFQIEKIIIPYNSEGKLKHTRVDFIVKGEAKVDLIIEVKPNYFVELLTDKITAIQKYCDTHGLRFLLVSEDLISNKDKLRTKIKECLIP